MFQNYTEVVNELRSKSGKVQPQRKIRRNTVLKVSDEWNFLENEVPEYVTLLVYDETVAIFEEGQITVFVPLKTLMGFDRLAEYVPFPVRPTQSTRSGLDRKARNKLEVWDSANTEWLTLESYHCVVADYQGKQMTTHDMLGDLARTS